MKKTIFAAAMILAACAFAALDVGDVTNVKLVADKVTVATNDVAIAKPAMKGIGQFVTFYAANANRTKFATTLYATNRADGGWTAIATGSTTATNAGTLRVSFPAIYLPRECKLELVSEGAPSVATSILLAY